MTKIATILYLVQMTERNTQKYQQRTEIFKAMAHPMRLYILDILSTQSPLCVCEIQEKTGMNLSTLSRQLEKLRKAGFITDRREGRNIYYSLKICCLENFIGCVEKVIESRESVNKELSC